VTSIQEQHTRLEPEDQQLVDLLADVLTDPDLHTDIRMRIHQEIEEILRAAHVDLHGVAGHEVQTQALEAHTGRLPDLLASAMVNPNLHTDTRMRLHWRLAEILSSARP